MYVNTNSALKEFVNGFQYTNMMMGLITTVLHYYTYNRLK